MRWCTQELKFWKVTLSFLYYLELHLIKSLKLICHFLNPNHYVNTWLCLEQFCLHFLFPYPYEIELISLTSCQVSQIFANKMCYTLTMQSQLNTDLLISWTFGSFLLLWYCNHGIIELTVALMVCWEYDS